jgi:hypothetical protein
MTKGNEAIHLLGIRLVGFYSIVVSVALMGCLLWLWPERMKDTAEWSELLTPDWLGHRPVGPDTRLLLVVLCMGALGSTVHAATSFASYVGNKRIVLSWTWWYLLRPFIGASLAVLFYFVVRGGFLSTNSAATDVSVFGVAAISGLAGMFSKQATDKLREVFDNLFRTEQGQGDDARLDKLGRTQPVSEVMIKRAKIVAFEIDDGKTVADVKVKDLHKKLGGVVTRVPVLTRSGVAICIMHQSLIYKFLADKSMASVGQATTFDPSAFTLEDMLKDEEIQKLAQNTIAFVPSGATLAETKAAMDKIPQCQDAFVTETGDPTGPVLGWVTDSEVRRAERN